MKLYLKNSIILLLLCLMTGVFITVSFIETPMKFQVQGITLPVALDLGKLMFGISTKIQCGAMVIILGIMILYRKNHTKYDFTAIIVLLLILILEKFWMLPVLDARATLLSAGKPVEPTKLHDYFIYAETVKAAVLILTIVLQFKTQPNEH